MLFSIPQGAEGSIVAAGSDVVKLGQSIQRIQTLPFGQTIEVEGIPSKLQLTVQHLE